MRKNCEEVLNAWYVAKKKRTADSIWTENGKVYSYGTLILERRYDFITGKWLFYLNMTKYSVTTTVHQNAIYNRLVHRLHDNLIIKFDDLPIGIQNLKDHYPSDEYNYTIIHKEAA